MITLIQKNLFADFRDDARPRVDYLENLANIEPRCITTQLLYTFTSVLIAHQKGLVVVELLCGRILSAGDEGPDQECMLG